MKNILILEDDLALSSQWLKALGTSRYTVHLATGAEQALDVFDNNDIDLCVVDFMVLKEGKPSADGGITFLGKMDPFKRKKTKILGVSGVSEKTMAMSPDKFLSAFGAHEFLQKPFSDHELVAEIESMLFEPDSAAYNEG